ncbi:hypothetical protein LY474_11570 [Myxococcus stipitatus]|uniref:delta-60 repeat domain-containing protein n=1 Tax=Myxococcus stipitatus TaxID=83455 RepID=UPI001F41775A|nr:delta-60 repeat domain-containing protein [Myxococcus stipitatus]MCE9668450.1 hypothetical protein [Myxococcus stipitatus]
MSNHRSNSISLQVPWALVAGGFLCVATSLTACSSSSEDPNNGALDTSFGVNGVVEVSSSYSSPSRLVLQPDGKWLVAGKAGYGCTPSGLNSADMAVWRLLPDGSRDADFGSGGAVSLDLCNYFEGVGYLQLLDDGRIFVFGGAGHVGFDNQCAFDPPTDGTFFARFTASGGRDTTLNGVGTNTFPSRRRSHVGYLDSARVDSRGRIVGVGVSAELVSQVLRFTPEGVADESFGTDGVILDATRNGEVDRSITLLPDDRFIIGETTEQGLKLWRHQVDGTLDEGFQFIPPGDFDLSTSVRPLTEGKLLLTGTTKDGAIVLVRLHEDGGLDSTFGTGGYVVVPGSGPDFKSERFVDVELQADGVMVVVTSGHQTKVVIGGTQKKQGVGVIHLSPNADRVLRKGTTFLEEWVDARDAAIDAEGYLHVIAGRGLCIGQPAGVILMRFHPYR